MDKTYWTRLALSTLANVTDDQADKVATQAMKLHQIWVDAGSPRPMPDTMDYGVWHAAALVFGSKCQCFKCCKARAA